jgi:hypothetical protein
LIVGHNPSEASWRCGFAYANPANAFMRLLAEPQPGVAGLLPAWWTLADQNRMPACLGIGLTDLGAEPGNDAAAFDAPTMAVWRADLLRRLRAHGARVRANLADAGFRARAAAVVRGAVATLEAERRAPERARPAGPGAPERLPGEPARRGASVQERLGEPAEENVVACAKRTRADELDGHPLAKAARVEAAGAPAVVAFAGKRQFEALFPPGARKPCVVAIIARKPPRQPPLCACLCVLRVAGCAASR